MRKGLAAVATAVSLLVFWGQPRAQSTPTQGYRLIRELPHDPEAFTQGLVYDGGVLYEGTGLNGKSSVRKVDLESGRLLKNQPLDSRYFGEGITLWKDKLVQLTWQTRIGFVYDKSTFHMEKTFLYKTEGWGLTHDGKRLILSDGTATLYFLDPLTFQELGKLEVTDQGRPVLNLNELEWVKGEIFANVWQSDRIARISPQTGKVVGWIDLADLRDRLGTAQVDVLNGIAYDAAKDRLFVTGKLWPKLFEIRLSR